MQSLDLFSAHIPLWWVLAYLVYMALVQALPRPGETDGKPYVILYQFLHGLSINLRLLFDPRKKGPEVTDGTG